MKQIYCLLDTFIDKITKINFFLCFYPSNQVHSLLDFLFARFFDTSVVLALTFIFVNPLKYWVTINLLLSGIFLSTSSIFFSRFCLFESIVLSFLTNSSYAVFLTTSFLLYPLVYLNQQELLSLSTCKLSTSDFKLGKWAFLAKYDVSISLAFFTSDFVA